MKNKTPLVIMEQTVMILVFAFAAAICMQVFVYSDKLSRLNQQRDNAIIMAQNTAEMLKSSGGEAEYTIYYDLNWQPVSEQENAAYRLETIYTESDNSKLWAADIKVYGSGNDLLFELPVAGQRWEVREDG